MEVSPLAKGIIGGILCSSALSGLFMFLTKSAQDRWMAAVKSEYDRELEALKDHFQRRQKSWQSRIDRAVFVSQAQFDTEFEAMKTIFKYATATWVALEAMRPMVTTRPANETEEQRMASMWDRWKRLAEAHDNFSSELEILSPFYPEPLYSALIKCRQAAQLELLQVQTMGSDAFDRTGYSDAIENRKQCSGGYKEAASIIRDRLAQLAVVT